MYSLQFKVQYPKPNVQRLDSDCAFLGACKLEHTTGATFAPPTLALMVYFQFYFTVLILASRRSASASTKQHPRRLGPQRTGCRESPTGNFLPPKRLAHKQAHKDTNTQTHKPQGPK